MQSDSATEPQVYTAWTKLIEAAASIKTAEPFRYDLVNTGREVLAQLAGPAGKNFTAAIGGVHLGFGRTVALHHRASTSYQIHLEIQRLCF